MKPIKEKKKISKEYKIELSNEDLINLEQFSKDYCITYTGCFKRGLRMLIESERQKNIDLENYQNNQLVNPL